MKNEKIVALVYIVCVWQDFAKEGSKARARARKGEKAAKGSCQWKSRVFFACARIFLESQMMPVLQVVFLSRFSLIFFHLCCFFLHQNKKESSFLLFSLSIDMDKSTRPVRSRKHSRLVQMCVCVLTCAVVILFYMRNYTKICFECKQFWLKLKLITK